VDASPRLGGQLDEFGKGGVARAPAFELRQPGGIERGLEPAYASRSVAPSGFGDRQRDPS